MNNREAVNWLINISADIGKAEHSDLWHYEQALIEIKDMLESAHPESSCYLGSPCEYQNPNAEIQEECKPYGKTAVAKSKRTFVELHAEYQHPDLCTYPEYKGKPYYSIKYIEDGECFIGFGTYKLEVLSRYLRDYFMPPVQPELNSENLVRLIEFGITATNSNDVYSIGMCNGMRWCKSLIDGVEPKFENAVTRVDDEFIPAPNCGADMRAGMEGMDNMLAELTDDVTATALNKWYKELERETT